MVVVGRDDLWRSAKEQLNWKVRMPAPAATAQCCALGQHTGLLGCVTAVLCPHTQNTKQAEGESEYSEKSLQNPA